MKNFKLHTFLLGIFVLISTCCCFLFLDKGGDIIRHSYAALISPSYNNDSPNTNYKEQDNLNTNYIKDGGNIPFSLYTATANSDKANTDYSIVQYHPTFLQGEDSGSHYYKMDKDSIPYIILSSKEGVAGSILNELYYKTLYFKFNDEKGLIDREEPMPNEEKKYGDVTLNAVTSIQNHTQDNPIQLMSQKVDIGLNNRGYVFALNLLDLKTEPDKAKCPQLPKVDNDEPGGEELYPNLGDLPDGNNDISHRTGLYTITITYNYSMKELHTSDKWVFEISFYVLDYGTYVTDGDTNPLSIQNADLFNAPTAENPTLQETFIDHYHIFNYNYANDPIAKYEATKFAMSFNYNFQNLSYEFKYKSFVTDNNPATPYNGIVTITNPKYNLDYTYYTYDEENNGYSHVAKFDFGDFEKFLFENSDKFYTFTYQGTFSFSLQILVRNNAVGSGYKEVDSSMFADDVLRVLNNEKLLIFGYDLRYCDNDPTSKTFKKYFSLENDFTRSSILAQNFITENKALTPYSPETPASDEGLLFYVPQEIATTNQVPLVFNSFGNLQASGIGGDYMANFIKFNASETSPQQVLEQINAVTNLEELDNLFTSDEKYYQSSTISGEGIWLMRMAYELQIPVKFSVVKDDAIEEKSEFKQIYGTQYVLFQINNSLQDLQVHAIDDNYLYNFNVYTNNKVRIAIEEKSNCFYSPVEVFYTISSTYNSNISNKNTLTLKTSDGEPVSYNFDGKKYNYFILNNDLDYTFIEDGQYKVTIKNKIDNTYRRYSFKIDTSKFNEVKIHEVLPNKNEPGKYYKGNEIIKNGIYLTNKPFTLSWQQKASGAKDFCYIARMQLSEKTSKKVSLFKEADDYLMTNNYLFDEVLLNTETNYQNSYGLDEITGRNFFKEDGLYFFYIYDQAGNYTSLIVLIDSTKANIEQGKWDNSNGNKWINTYSSIGTNNNIISSDTQLYFGTHKALELPSMINDKEVFIDNTNYTAAYDKTTGEYQSTKQKGIKFNFYTDVIKTLTNFIRTTKNNNDLFYYKAPGATELPEDEAERFYIVLKNNSIDYTKISLNPSNYQDIVAKGSLNEARKYSTMIYTMLNNNKDYLFQGEARYTFTVNNANGLQTKRFIEMNFDTIKGLFEAYNKTPDNSKYISNNMGTNLNTLKFSYTVPNMEGQTEEDPCYKVRSISYEYFSFALDPNDYNSQNKNLYPFSKIPDTNQLIETNVTGNVHTFDKINVRYSPELNANITKDGKYIVTRTLRGGDYNLINGEYVRVPKEQQDEFGYYGGNYLQIKTGEDGNGLPQYEYKALFELDTIERKYVIYVDHNQIISTTMLQSHTPEIKEVGENINIQLNYSEDYKTNENAAKNIWTFKDFYKNSSSHKQLVTNKAPVKINIPRSKYYFPLEDSFVYCYNSFSELSAKIEYIDNSGKSTFYIADGFNPITGYLTSSQLKQTNGSGYFIFSQAGKYIITIEDHTGYIDYEKGQTNVGATKYEFSFFIAHNNPKASVYTNIYNPSTKDFEERKLKNEDGSNNYAINTQPKNSLISPDIPNNELLVVWEDSTTPYEARINQISITKIQDGESPSTQIINLLDFNLEALVGTNLLNGLGYNSIISLDLSYYDEKRPSEKFDGKDYNRYKYSLSLNIENESTYDIIFYYDINNKDKNYNYARYTIRIDRTKPNMNVDRLINSDSFLNSYYLSKNPESGLMVSDFKKEETLTPAFMEKLPSTLTYAFNLNRDYKLYYNHVETMPYFYIRHYDFMREHPSLTPDLSGIDFYENEIIFGQYPRFAENIIVDDMIQIEGNLWYKVPYSDTSLTSQILNTFGSPASGFYEIIEKDHSGNFRTFTVHFLDPNRFSYEILNFSGIHTPKNKPPEIITTEDLNNTPGGNTHFSQTDLTAHQSFNILNLYSELQWGKVIISDIIADKQFNKGEAITLMPNRQNLTQTLTEKLNHFFNSSPKETSFKITLYSSNLNVSRRINFFPAESKTEFNPVKVVEFPGELSGKTSYKLYLAKRTEEAVIFLKQFKLRKWNDLTSNWGDFIVDFKDESAIISQYEVTGLTQGIYQMIYVTNYNTNQIRQNLYLGQYQIEDFNRRYAFEYNTYYDKASNTYYTGGNIDITYEANLYIVRVNGVTITGTKNEHITPELSSYNCKTFTLSKPKDILPAEQEQGSIQHFKVEYLSKTEGVVEKVMNFTIFDKLPSIQLTNDKENSEKIFSSTTEIVEQSANVIVNVNWDKLTGCPCEELNDSELNFVTQMFIYSRNSDGKFDSMLEIKRDTVINEQGSYKLVLKNSILGNFRTIYFSIDLDEVSLYSVYEKGETDNDARQIFPSKWERLDLSLNIKQINPTDGAENEQVALIDYIYNGLTYLKNRRSNVNTLNNIVERDKTELDILFESFGFKDGIFNVSNIGIANITHLNHFYTTKNQIVKYNSNQKLNVIQFVFKNNSLNLDQKEDTDYVFFQGEPGKTNLTPKENDTKFWTTIYLVYTLKGPIKIELFAVTKVPENTSIINNRLLYNDNPINLDTDKQNKVLTNKDVPSGTIKLSWNALAVEEKNTYWYNQGNYIFVSDKFGVSNKFSDLKVEHNNLLNSAYITSAGQHDLMFYDLAGNKHIFESNNSSPIKYYSLLYINQVIYSIKYQDKNYNPIQYGVFNDNLTLVIEEINKRFDLSDLMINITCNGQPLGKNDYLREENSKDETLYTFSKPGKYIVQISAKYQDSELKTATYNFTILSTVSARLAFEFPEIAGYEIKTVIRNASNITDTLKDKDGKIKSLFITSTEAKTGNGFYTVVLQYGPDPEDLLKFSFLINNFEPPISCNIPYGETTKGEIVLTYNPNLIFSRLGNCYLNILAFNNDTKRYYVFDRVSINENSGSKAEYKLDKPNAYCIQVSTINGNTVSSFTVNKVEPLNTFAIIVIVISVVAAIVLIAVIIKLRTRMRVR